MCSQRSEFFGGGLHRALLPCFGELQRRHIMEQARCPLCGNENVTLYHNLLTCDHARRFWEAGQLHFDTKAPKLHPRSGAMDILNLSLVLKKNAAVMVTIMWAIWHSRNNLETL